MINNNNNNKINKMVVSSDVEYTNDELRLYVLNENNKKITKIFLVELLRKYNIELNIKHVNRFQTAMTHISYLERDFRNDRLLKFVKENSLEPIPKKKIKKAIPLRKKSYERLEFLGDSVIHLILADYLYSRYPNEQEGFMTRLRTKIESGETLANFCRVLGLQEYVLIARNIENIGARNDNDHILEDVFEAFIGALYLETSFETCKKLIIKLIEQRLDIPKLIYNETNYKDTLLQMYHKWKWPDPEYGSKGYVEEDGKKIFLMYVKGYIENNNELLEWKIVGEGRGTSKRKGEQEAAKNALIYFGIVMNNDISDDELSEVDFNYS